MSRSSALPARWTTPRTIPRPWSANRRNVRRWANSSRPPTFTGRTLATPAQACTDPPGVESVTSASEPASRGAVSSTPKVSGPSASVTVRSSTTPPGRALPAIRESLRSGSRPTFAPSTGGRNRSSAGRLTVTSSFSGGRQTPAANPRPVLNRSYWRLTPYLAPTSQIASRAAVPRESSSNRTPYRIARASPLVPRLSASSVTLRISARAAIVRPAALIRRETGVPAPAGWALPAPSGSTAGSGANARNDAPRSFRSRVIPVPEAVVPSAASTVQRRCAATGCRQLYRWSPSLRARRTTSAANRLLIAISTAPMAKPVTSPLTPQIIFPPAHATDAAPAAMRNSWGLSSRSVLSDCRPRLLVTTNFAAARPNVARQQLFTCVQKQAIAVISMAISRPYPPEAIFTPPHTHAR